MLRLNHAGAALYKQYWGKHPHSKLGGTLYKKCLSPGGQSLGSRGQREAVTGHRTQKCKSGTWKPCLVNSQIADFFFFFKFGCTDLRAGNGNPLQYSCLENPMDGGAW